MPVHDQAPGDGPSLLGRERERQELDRLLATARSGGSGVLALVGEPGIGKSALLEYAASRAGGLSTLRACGLEAERNVPFAALFELLRPALGLLDRIPAPQAAALEGALALRPGTGAGRFSIGAATLSLLAAYAEQSPALALIDDAHLLDASSAEALLFALRRMLAEPLAVVIAAREGEPSLLSQSGLRSHRVSGLDRGSAGTLLGAVPEPVAERLFRATGGNPLALIELRGEATHLDAAAIDAPIPVPTKIANVFARRVADLGEPARRVLLLVAVSDSGELTTLERAARTLELDLSILDEAVAAGLLRLGEGRVEFRHPLVRAAIYSAASAQERRAAHRTVCDALPDRDQDRRAWHLANAAVGVDDAVASALEQSGARALEREAFAVAAEAFARAGALSRTDDRRALLLTEAADAAWLAGLPERALELLDEAATVADGTSQLVSIEHLRGRIAVRRGPVREGLAILASAAERVAPQDSELAVTMLAEVVDAGLYAGDARVMVRAADRAQELLGAAAGARPRFLAAITRGMALVLAGDGQAGAAALREAVALAESHPELQDDPQLLPWLVIGPLFLREADSGRTLIEDAIASARSRAALGPLPWLLVRIARDRAAGDQWDAARVSYDEAIRLGRETGQHIDVAAATAGLAWLEGLEGRATECRRDAAEARELCQRLGVDLLEAWAMRAIAELELGRGDTATALARFEELGAHLDAVGIGDVDVWPGAELVDCNLRLGRDSEASAAADRLRRESEAKGQPWSLARAKRCEGLLASDGEYERHFQAALRLHASTPDVFEAARTHLAFGGRLRRGRRRKDSRRELRAALETFERLGADPWSELARNELTATGETARRRDVSALDQMTPQELHIAQLLTEGRTTREAAATLFLSPKTIEYHLRSIYRKLGVQSRAQLGEVLESAKPVA